MKIKHQKCKGEKVVGDGKAHVCDVCLCELEETEKTFEFTLCAYAAIGVWI